MTAPVRAIVGHADLGESEQWWRDFLTVRLDPSWRPGEWNPQTLIFTGDPHNPRTFVYLCASPGARIRTVSETRCAHFALPNANRAAGR